MKENIHQKDRIHLSLFYLPERLSSDPGWSFRFSEVSEEEQKPPLNV